MQLAHCGEKARCESLIRLKWEIDRWMEEAWSVAPGKAAYTTSTVYPWMEMPCSHSTRAGKQARPGTKNDIEVHMYYGCMQIAECRSQWHRPVHNRRAIIQARRGAARQQINQYSHALFAESFCLWKPLSFSLFYLGVVCNGWMAS